MACYANAREFLEAVWARYLALEAYSDRGLVRRYPTRPREADLRLAYRQPGFPARAKLGFERHLQSYLDTRARLRGKPESETPFETAYRGPERFRFAWSSAHPYPPLRHRKIQSVVGCDAEGPYTFRRVYDGSETLERNDSIASTIAGASGVSAGAAHTIGFLLFKECGGRHLIDMRRPRLRGLREIDGVDCVAVVGRHSRCGRITAWFGRDDLLLRRVVEHRSRDEELRFNVRTSVDDPAPDFAAP